MKPFFIDALERNRVYDIASMRSWINMTPTYQRQAGIWSPPKKQLFVDSLLNGFDVPKFYFHEVSANGFRYAVIDGKQRLEAVFDFLDDRYPLSDEFEWYEDHTRELSGFLYSQLPPQLQAKLDAYRLPVQVVQTEDLQWVEELFTRLNESVALNAPERRNALGGPIPELVRSLPAKPFFTDRLPFANSRYRHYDLATKFLFLEHVAGPAPTKRKALDEFVLEFRKRNATQEAATLCASTETVLGRLETVFGERDVLLSSLGLVVVYYLLERERVLSSIADCRHVLASFDELRRQIRALMSSQGTEPGRVTLDPRLVEFERLSQSPNDHAAMRTRMDTLRWYLEDPSRIAAKMAALR